MNKNNKPVRNNPWWWAGGVLPALLGLILLVSPAGQLLTFLSFDSLYLFRPTTDHTNLADVVILNMDEESRKELHQDPDRAWDRNVHARLLTELAARHARLVVFDVLFDITKDDEQFAAAIQSHGNVLLAAHLETTHDEGRPATSHLFVPAGSLGATVLWAVDNLEPDEDSTSIIRKQFTKRDYTNLAWQAAVAFGRSPPDRLVSRWLNYYGPAETLPTVSYHRVFETNSLPPDFFAGKAVFIGVSSLISSQGQSSDRHATPFSRWRGGQTSGVEIHATAFLNLIRNEWLEELSPLAEVILVAISGLLLGLGLGRVQPRTGVIIAVLLVVIVTASAMALAWGYHRLFPWLLICLIQIPCALAWSVLMHITRLTREKDVLEGSLALAESAGSLPDFLRENEPASNLASSNSATSPITTVGESQPPPIPNHRLIRRIGRGSYGEVWVAQDEIGTYHAVKVVYQRSFNTAAPYEREFRGIQKFTPISRNHPGFVHVLHVGRNDAEGYFFYIMELGDDKFTSQNIDPATYSPNTLSSLLEGGRLSLPACVKLGIELTTALQYLHEQKLVHRDIKPSNIIFVNQSPKFADIGLVTSITPGGKDMTYVGTDGYMPPEGPGTVAADIFSLGKVLYEAYTGKDRQEFPALSGTLIANANEKLVGFNEVVLKACHSDVNHRYRTVSEIHADLLKLSGDVKYLQ